MSQKKSKLKRKTQRVAKANLQLIKERASYFFLFADNDYKYTKIVKKDTNNHPMLGYRREIDEVIARAS